jgi:hypothetical protein
VAILTSAAAQGVHGIGSVWKEHFDPLDRLLGGWHRPDLGLNALCGPTISRVVEQRTNRASDRGDSRLVAIETASGASRDHGVRVGVLIGALRHDEEGQAVRKGRALCPTLHE